MSTPHPLTAIDAQTWRDDNRLRALREVIGDILDIVHTKPTKGGLIHVTRTQNWTHRAYADHHPEGAVLFWTVGQEVADDQRLLKADSKVLHLRFPPAAVEAIVDPYIAFLQSFPPSVPVDTTNISVDRSAVWERLPELAGHLRRLARASTYVESPEVLDDKAVTEGRIPRQQNAARRDAVERYSMRVALAYYAQQYGAAKVKDVHATNPFDLCCQTPGGEIHVEVKGTMGVGRSVIVTVGEINAAHCTRTVLFVVSGIKLREDDVRPETGTGSLSIYPDWRPVIPLFQSGLEPLTFSYLCDIPAETPLVSSFSIPIDEN